MANAPSAQAMSRQPKAEQTDTFFQDLRGLLKEMVHQSLQQKPPEIPEDEYFEHLEPILNTLASECVVQQPKNLKSFAQQWVQEKHDDHKAMEGVSPFGRIAMQSWKQESPEIESLRQHGFLKEVLQSSEHGRKVFHAMEQRDRNGLLSLLEPVQVVQEAQKVQEFEVQKSSIQMQRGPGFSALHYLGKVLRNLRHEGITSASAAFMYFNPDQDWTVPVSRMKLQLRRMQVLNGDQINELLNYLDDAGIGTISYRPFRTAVAEFLAISRDFHSALSPEEFTAILCRIQDRLQRTGMTFTEAVREAEGKNSLAGAQFMQSLRNLRLGLSNKEVAQIFNSLSANSFRIAGTTHLPNPVQNGQVSVVLFEALLDKSTMDNRLQDWAMAAFPRLREILGTEQAVQTALRQHAEPPLRQYLPFTGFAALVTDADPSIMSAEISKLWCVLEKDDFSDEPLVRFEEFLHWINAEAPKVKGKKPEYGLFA